MTSYELVTRRVIILDRDTAQAKLWSELETLLQHRYMNFFLYPNKWIHKTKTHTQIVKPNDSDWLMKELEGQFMVLLITHMNSNNFLFW